MSLDQSKGWDTNFHLLYSDFSHFLCAVSKVKVKILPLLTQAGCCSSISFPNCKRKREVRKTSIKSQNFSFELQFHAEQCCC